MSVSSRIVCLLLLVHLDGVASLDPVLRCPTEGCGEHFEVDLGIDEVLAFAPMDTDALFDAEIAGAQLCLRLPTGTDELTWQRANFDGPEAAREAILRSLVMSPLPEIPPAGWLDAVEAAMDEHDPLVCFAMDVFCPACSAPGRHEVPLAELALAALRRAQSRMIESVHLLAARYGWTEREVFALPAWRRERYVALAKAEVS